MPKPTITVTLPTLLATVQGASSITVEAATLEEALNALRTHAILGVHLFDESGKQRPHVLFLFKSENTLWLKPAAVPLAEGDTLTVLQAVSGG